MKHLVFVVDISGKRSRLQSKWDDLIDQKLILLENRWEKIKDENQWGKLEKDSEKPNWICKDCFDGGILLQIQN